MIGIRILTANRAWNIGMMELKILALSNVPIILAFMLQMKLDSNSRYRVDKRFKLAVYKVSVSVMFCITKGYVLLCHSLQFTALWFCVQLTK